MLRWVKQLVKLGFAFILLLLVLGFSWEHWSLWRAPRVYPPRGQLVDIGGREIHLVCSGIGEPTVVLEPGAGALGSLPWVRVVTAMGEYTRVCRYDRAGFFWSDADTQHRDALRIADDLHGLVQAGAISPPFVMVGHSLGGILIRVYDDRYPGEVAGFVFVDSSHPDQERRAPPELQGATGGGPPQALVAMLGRVGVLRLAARLSAPDREFSELDRIALAFAPKSMLASMAEMSARDSIVAQGRRTGSLDPRPIVVLTAGQTSQTSRPGVSEETIARMQELRIELQEELADLSANSDHRTVEDAGHVIQMDDPDAVAKAIREVVNAVRTGTPLGTGDSGGTW